MNQLAGTRMLRSMPLLLALFVLMTSGCGRDLPNDGKFETVQLDGRTFRLQVSMGNDSRTLGLGGRSALDADGGMLFVFPDAARRGFWMYDCLMDIDIAFIDPLGHVTAIHTMPLEPPRGETESIIEYEARLPRYRSGFPAQYAIELRPGMFDELGITKGERLPLDMDRMKALAELAEPTLPLTGSR